MDMNAIGSHNLQQAIKAPRLTTLCFQGKTRCEYTYQAQTSAEQGMAAAAPRADWQSCHAEGEPRNLISACWTGFLSRVALESGIVA
jgi:hypothetical protein